MKFSELIQESKNKVRSENENIVARVVDALVEQELGSRADIIRKGVDEYRRIEKELAGIRAKSPGFDAAGTELPHVFTSEQMSQKKKAEESLTKLDSALTKAIAEGDYVALQRLIEGK